MKHIWCCLLFILLTISCQTSTNKNTIEDYIFSFDGIKNQIHLALKHGDKYVENFFLNGKKALDIMNAMEN